jgi:hypothetical protein
MADWKEIYLSLMKDTDKAIRTLEKGQEKCEEIYLRSEDLLVSPPQDEAPAREQREDGTEE